MFPDLDFFSIGVAIKDSFGSVLATLSKPFTCTFSLESVEVLALREGLVLATQLGFKVSWAEVNAVNVAAGQPSAHPFNWTRDRFRKGGGVVRGGSGGSCVRPNFSKKPAVRIEGFDCLDRDWRNCSSIPALA
ncbi:hypothetical protein LWI28_025603 [Acer negundo]|uniref:RNase H type-1 domain-containing protein n=1 Tax=Acer negundo TaxID=4023 RepID=A0AAD5NP84_ACENE|nr:hypothetical protein LWI28_025603 [Acer negundo]